MNRIVLALISSVTLGLAPFFPEPHVWEKLKWLVGDQIFKPIDWFDLLMHSAPWIWLIIEIVKKYGLKK